MHGAVFVASALVVLAACSSTHRGFGRGRSIALHVSENVELRSARPVIDAAHKSVTVAWFAAKTPEDKPPVDEFTLVVFDDANGDHRPDPGEIRATRANPSPSAYILFGPVNVKASGSIDDLRAQLRVHTAREEREVNWELARRDDLY